MMMYVLGDNDNGTCASFQRGEVEKIKELAKKSFYEQNLSSV